MELRNRKDESKAVGQQGGRGIEDYGSGEEGASRYKD